MAACKNVARYVNKLFADHRIEYKKMLRYRGTFCCWIKAVLGLIWGKKWLYNGVMKHPDFRRSQREVHKIMAKMGQEPSKFDKPLPPLKKSIEIEQVAINVTPVRPGEYILYHSKPHWIHLLRSSLLVGTGLFCTCCTLFTAFSEPSPGRQPVSSETIQTLITCSTCLLAFALFSTFVSTLHYINSDFYLTNKRVISKSGGFRQKTLEIFFNKIDSLYVETSLLGRLLGYGTIVIMSGASEQRLFKFANPQQIRNAIVNQIPR